MPKILACVRNEQAQSSGIFVSLPTSFKYFFLKLQIVTISVRMRPASSANPQVPPLTQFSDSA
jgi:hypothetical protein